MLTSRIFCAHRSCSNGFKAYFVGTVIIICLFDLTWRIDLISSLAIKNQYTYDDFIFTT